MLQQKFGIRNTIIRGTMETLDIFLVPGCRPNTVTLIDRLHTTQQNVTSLVLTKALKIKKKASLLSSIGTPEVML